MRTSVYSLLAIVLFISAAARADTLLTLQGTFKGGPFDGEPFLCMLYIDETTADSNADEIRGRFDNAISAAEIQLPSGTYRETTASKVSLIVPPGYGEMGVFSILLPPDDDSYDSVVQNSSSANNEWCDVGQLQIRFFSMGNTKFENTNLAAALTRVKNKQMLPQAKIKIDGKLVSIDIASVEITREASSPIAVGPEGQSQIQIGSSTTFLDGYQIISKLDAVSIHIASNYYSDQLIECVEDFLDHIDVKSDPASPYELHVSVEFVTSPLEFEWQTNSYRNATETIDTQVAFLTARLNAPCILVGSDGFYASRADVLEIKEIIEPGEMAARPRGRLSWTPPTRFTASTLCAQVLKILSSDISNESSSRSMALVGDRNDRRKSHRNKVNMAWQLVLQFLETKPQLAASTFNLAAKDMRNNIYTLSDVTELKLSHLDVDLDISDWRLNTGDLIAEVTELFQTYRQCNSEYKTSEFSQISYLSRRFGRTLVSPNFTSNDQAMFEARQYQSGIGSNACILKIDGAYVRTRGYVAQSRPIVAVVHLSNDMDKLRTDMVNAAKTCWSELLSK